MKNIRSWLLAVFIAALAGCGGGSQCALVGGAICGETKVLNVAPVAKAGASQSVLVGSTVTLDGTGSSDENRDALSYQWSLLAKPEGSQVALSDPASAMPKFAADVKGEYRFGLVVSDGRLSSSTAEVLIRVAAVNAAPVANAGPNQSVLLGSTVTLDGRDSSDANREDVLSLRWVLSKPDGTQSLLTGVRPVFTANLVGVYLATLTVSDGALASDPVAVRVQVSAINAPPVAQAGSAQTVEVGNLVRLDGTDSSDANPKDVLSYRWSFVSQLPAGSSAVLTNPLSAKPSFTADVAGVYVVGLVVNDGQTDSAVSVVVVSALPVNIAPVAKAGSNQSVLLGSGVVRLDGSGSTDANGDTLSYQWALLSKPASSLSTLSESTSVRPAFTPDVPGEYIFSLLVRDGKLSSVPSAVSVTVSEVNAPPVANAGIDQSVLINTVVTLDGRESSDANRNDVLTFTWSLVRPDGTSAVLTGVRPTFTAAMSGAYTASLTVRDALSSSEPDAVRVLVSALNAPPVAVITAASSVLVGGAVQLSAANSTDSNRDALTFSWSLLSKPMKASGALADSAAVLAAPTLVNPVFTADVAGVYVLSLVVSDGKVNSEPVTVTVTASSQNLPPVANAGPEQVVVVGAPVTLSGSASTDPNGDTLTYQWSLTTRPNLSAATLTNPNTVGPTFTPDLAGFYVATLTVNDSKGGTHVSRVLIKAE